MNLLVIYLDGVIFGDHHVLVALAVDEEGKKHVLGLAEGARENQVVAKGLLEEVVRRCGRHSPFSIHGLGLIKNLSRQNQQLRTLLPPSLLRLWSFLSAGLSDRDHPPLDAAQPIANPPLQPACVVDLLHSPG